MSETNDLNRGIALAEVRDELTAAYEETCRQAENDKLIKSPEARKLLSLLLIRQKDALEILDAVRTEVEGEVPRAPVKSDSVAERVAYSGIVNNPLFRMALTGFLAAMCLVSVFVGSIGIIGLLIAGFLFAVEFIKANRHQETPEPEYVSRLSLDGAFKQNYSSRMSAGLVRDMQDIMNLFSATALDASAREESDMAEMYQTIYSAYTENRELLQPVLDRQEQMLWRIGLEAVPYTDGMEAAFDIDEADCPSQMIYPAVRRKKDKTTVRRGSYIKSI